MMALAVRHIYREDLSHLGFLQISWTAWPWRWRNYIPSQCQEFSYNKSQQDALFLNSILLKN